MAKMLVSVFQSHRDAEKARQRLREHGFDEKNMRVERGQTAQDSSTPTPERGLAGVIERMFSGLLLDDDIARYARPSDKGQSILALHAADDAAIAHAASVLRESDAAKSISGPDIYALPNSPTSWNEATWGTKSYIGDALRDPGRPDGLIRDASGLGTDDTNAARNESTGDNSKKNDSCGRIEFEALASNR
jgi:hypothetical protein